MAATTGGALKALLEAAGLGISVFRDRAPEGRTLVNAAGTATPYVTVFEGVSVVPDPAFNSFDDDEHHVIELAQVDVWQQWRDPQTGAVTESYTLPAAVAAALNGARLSAAPTHVSGVVLRDGPRRLLELEENVVHHAITVEVRRTLTAV